MRLPALPAMRPKGNASQHVTTRGWRHGVSLVHGHHRTGKGTTTRGIIELCGSGQTKATHRDYKLNLCCEVPPGYDPQVQQ